MHSTIWIIEVSTHVFPTVLIKSVPMSNFLQIRIAIKGWKAIPCSFTVDQIVQRVATFCKVNVVSSHSQMTKAIEKWKGYLWSCLQKLGILDCHQLQLEQEQDQSQSMKVCLTQMCLKPELIMHFHYNYYLQIQ